MDLAKNGVEHITACHVDIEKSVFTNLFIYCSQKCEIEQEAETLHVTSKFKVFQRKKEKISRLKLGKAEADGDLEIQFLGTVTVENLDLSNAASSATRSFDVLNGDLVVESLQDL